MWTYCVPASAFRIEASEPVAPIAVRYSQKGALAPMHAAISELVRASLLIVGALFPIVDSPDNIPIFLTLTRGLSTESRAVLARKIAIDSFGILIVSVLIGTHILAFFGISLPVVQVGGGLIVTAVGWKLMNRPDDDAKAPESSPKPLKERLSFRLLGPPGVLSVDNAADRGTWFDFGSDRRGCKPGTRRRGPLDSARSSVLGMRGHSGQHLPDVSLCRANRAHCRRDCNERYLSLVGVHSRLYRRTDRVEWNECAAADDPRRAAIRQAGDVFYSESEQPGCSQSHDISTSRRESWQRWRSTVGHVRIARFPGSGPIF
jgi:hypothetical protein